VLECENEPTFHTDFVAGNENITEAEMASSKKLSKVTSIGHKFIDSYMCPTPLSVAIQFTLKHLQESARQC